VYTSATGCSITRANTSATSSTVCTCGPEYIGVSAGEPSALRPNHVATVPGMIKVT
jgi:hypothetical protein